jgi:hypothetical protein
MSLGFDELDISEFKSTANGTKIDEESRASSINNSAQVPPLLSNSPPPILSDDSINSATNESGIDFQVDSRNVVQEPNLTQSIAEEAIKLKAEENNEIFKSEINNDLEALSTNLESVNKPTDESQSHQDAYSESIMFQTNFEAFAINSNENPVNDTELSNWANFEHVSFEPPTLSSTIEPAFNDNSSINSEGISNANNTKLQQISKNLESSSKSYLFDTIESENEKSHQQQQPENEKNSENKISESKDNTDEDDEWGNFVDVRQPHTTFIDANIPINSTDLPNKSTEFNANMTAKNEMNQLTLVENMLNEIFASVNKDEIFKHEKNESKESNRNENIELDMMSDNQIWQELLLFTSIIDMSNSLNFKWSLSDLEESYLDSLSLHRAKSQVSNI